MQAVVVKIVVWTLDKAEKKVFFREQTNAEMKYILSIQYLFLDADASLDFVLSLTHSLTQSVRHQNSRPLIG